MALDPEVFGDGFGGRLQQMMDEHRSLEPASVFYDRLLIYILWNNCVDVSW